MLAIWGGSFLEPDPWTYFFGPGIGSNLGASFVWVVIAGVAAAVLWPPLRRRIHRFVDRKLDAVHAKLDAHRALHDAHASSLAALHDKLDRLLNEKENP